MIFEKITDYFDWIDEKRRKEREQRFNEERIQANKEIAEINEKYAGDPRTINALVGMVGCNNSDYREYSAIRKLINSIRQDPEYKDNPVVQNRIREIIGKPRKFNSRNDKPKIK